MFESSLFLISLSAGRRRGNLYLNQSQLKPPMSTTQWAPEYRHFYRAKDVAYGGHDSFWYRPIHFNNLTSRANPCSLRFLTASLSSRWHHVCRLQVERRINIRGLTNHLRQIIYFRKSFNIVFFEIFIARQGLIMRMKFSEVWRNKCMGVSENS